MSVRPTPFVRPFPTSRITIAGFAAAASLGALPAQLPAVITSTFDAGSVEGWTHAGAAVFNAPTTGGNPGGYLHIDNSEGPVTYILAPASFRGDLRAYRGGTLSFDGKMIGTGGSPWSNALDYGHVFLRNGATQVTVEVEPALPPTAQFTTYTIALDPLAWGTTSATFDAILANVTELRISVEALFGAEVQAIDNVRLAPGPTPASAVAFAAGCPQPGAPHTLTATQLPWLGATFQATAAGLPSPVFAVGVYGLAPVVPSLPLSVPFPQALPGCALHVSPDLLVASFTATGTATTSLAIPTAPPLVGATFRHQVVPLRVDAGLSIVAVTATDALLLTIGIY